MKLSDLLTSLIYDIVQGTEETEAGKVTNDTRDIEPGDVFVCIEGAVKDGHMFAREAIEKGAAVLVVQEVKKIQKTAADFPRVTIVKVTDSRYALAMMSAVYYGNPADHMKIIGVTGTKGKTTTACMIHRLLVAAGQKAGLIGTIRVDTGAAIYRNHNTTPESCQIHAYLKEMKDAGCEVAVMEVSSQGLKLQRTAGILFEAGIFTNLGKDHIGPGEHADFEEYKQCKHLLFTQCKYGIGNIDDPFYEEMFERTDCTRITYGLDKSADERAQNVRRIKGRGFLGICYEARGLTDCQIELAMPGKFNIYNSLAAVTVLHLLGVPDRVITNEFPKIKVPGRMECVEGLTDCSVFVDYAHNAMSLRSILMTVREYEAGRIVVVFGCGGSRSKERRFEMGETAGRYGDFIVITTDNPRYEDPLQIIQDIITGINRTRGAYIAIPDRRSAIRYAIEHREPQDVIIIAGKGHETYQEIGGVRYGMDDRTMVLEAIEAVKNR